MFTVLFINMGFAQDTISLSNPHETQSINKQRLIPVITTASAGYAVSMVGLYSLWYKNNPMGNFHYINDNKAWLQMDKAGHGMTSYYLSRVAFESLHWSGVSNANSTLYGGLFGITYLTTIEILDGFSTGWGASKGDMVANLAGVCVFTGQQLLWKEQRVVLKWSYHNTPYAKFYPASLGHTFSEKLLKDYNGQTYWLSANIASFGLQHTRFPKWLNIAGGYGIESVTGSYGNVSVIPGESVPNTDRRRQYYIALDIDPGKFPVKSKSLKTLLNIFGFIKIPLPAIEFDNKGTRFKVVYF
jgi:uncharacterized protein YfiM (DUF2279 family)